MSTHKNNTIYKHNSGALSVSSSHHKRKPFFTEMPFSAPRTPITPFSLVNNNKNLSTTTTLKKRIGTARRIFQTTDQFLVSAPSTVKKNKLPLSEQSAKKLTRMDTLEIGGSEDEEFHPQTATPSVKKFRKMGINDDNSANVNNRICFWARPRHYPVKFFLKELQHWDRRNETHFYLL